jgi:hypothetical protein
MADLHDRQNATIGTIFIRERKAISLMKDTLGPAFDDEYQRQILNLLFFFLANVSFILLS